MGENLNMLKHLQSREDWNEKSLSAKGFTLIELLVVIIILGILAGVAIFAIGNITKKSNANACTNERDTLENAIESWRLANDQPSTVVPTITQLTNATTGTLKKTPKYWDVDGTGIIQDSSQTFNWQNGECIFP